MHTVRTSPKDFFLNLFAIVSLYVSVAGFLTIVFQIANLSLPDPLESGWHPEEFTQRLRVGIALLIVAFPSYLGVVTAMYRINQKTPEKWTLGIRRWLGWFTLFIAAVVIMIDLIVLIHDVLGGELRLRFILKSISVLFIMIAIFGYYLWDLRIHRNKEE